MNWTLACGKVLTPETGKNPFAFQLAYNRDTLHSSSCVLLYSQKRTRLVEKNRIVYGNGNKYKVFSDGLGRIGKK